MNPENEQMIPERRRGRVIASPRARRAMRQRSLDPALLRGSGPGGRIVEADVLATAGSQDPRRAHVGHVSNVPLARSTLETCSTFYLQATADVGSLLEIWSQIADEIQRICGTPLRLADFLLRAMGLALADCAQANRVWQGERCVPWKTADVGIEIDAAGSRITPVICQADRLRLVDLVSERKRCLELSPNKASDASSATAFCDLTDYPIDQYVAVLSPPRTSVLAAGRPTLRPMAVENRSYMRQSLCLSLTADHRAMSPETAAAFLGRIVELLEHPFLLLCERLPR
jgi:pyruvate dehydrogenase E2 component (dihydrolipoamide acetyltransferase)